MGGKVVSKLQSNPDYKAAREALRDSSVRIVAHNTVLIDKGADCVALALHGNEIIRWYSDGRIDISDGGYASVTTKSRLNQYTSARVFQKNHDWYFTNSAGETVKFLHAAEGQAAHMYYSRNCARAWNRIAEASAEDHN